MVHHGSISRACFKKAKFGAFVAHFVGYGMCLLGRAGQSRSTFLVLRQALSRPCGKQRAAFSTIEVMMGVLVCALMFVSLYAGFSAGFSLVQLTRENLRATQILGEKMETIRLYRWDQITNSGYMSTNFVDVFYPLATQATTGLSFTGRVNIVRAPVTEFYGDDLLQVTIDLQWLSGNIVRNRQMSTFVSKYGLQHYVY
jgi:hypothetical protein